MGNGNELENLVVRYQEAGQDWIKTRLVSDQLEEDLKPYLASLMNELDDGDKSEAKLDREARGSKQFRDYVKNMVLARADTARKKVRYESLGMLWEAKRSELAMEREKLSKGIYHEGG